MSDMPTFLARCLSCGDVVGATSTIEHACTTNYWDTTYNEEN